MWECGHYLHKSYRSFIKIPLNHVFCCTERGTVNILGLYKIRRLMYLCFLSIFFHLDLFIHSQLKMRALWTWCNWESTFQKSFLPSFPTQFWSQRQYGLGRCIYSKFLPHFKCSRKLEPPREKLAALFKGPGVGDLRLLHFLWVISLLKPTARWTRKNPWPDCCYEGITYSSWASASQLI